MAAVVRPSSLDDAVTYVLDEKLPSGAARGATMAQALVQAGAMQLVGMESERKAQLADFDNTVVPKASVTQKNGSREAFVIRSVRFVDLVSGEVERLPCCTVRGVQRVLEAQICWQSLP